MPNTGRHLSPFLRVTALVGEAAIDRSCGPMVRTLQTAEKLFPNLLKVGAAEITEQLHSIESVSPSFQYFGAGRSAEGEFLIRKRQYLRHREPGMLQVTSQFSTHMEIVPSGCERIFGVGREQSLRPITDWLMSEQIINFREYDPTVRF